MGHKALTEQGGKVLLIAVIHHIHVKTGIERKTCSLFPVRSKTLVYKLFHSIPVGHHKSAVPPFLLKYFSHGVMVGRPWSPAYIVE